MSFYILQGESAERFDGGSVLSLCALNKHHLHKEQVFCQNHLRRHLKDILWDGHCVSWTLAHELFSCGVLFTPHPSQDVHSCRTEAPEILLAIADFSNSLQPNISPNLNKLFYSELKYRLTGGRYSRECYIANSKAHRS